MEPQAIADALAAIAPRAKPPTTPVPPIDLPIASPGLRRRGRPPKKLDADFYAAKAMIAPEGSASSPPHAPARKSRKVFRPIAPGGVGAEAGEIKSTLQPRPPTVQRAWPIARPGRTEPPRLTVQERKEITDIYITRFGPIL